MGLISTLGDWLSSFAPLRIRDSVVQTEKPATMERSYAMIQQLGQRDYVTLDLVENAFLRDDVSEFTEGTELDTVFICGGYAAYMAGYTHKYGDIDFFCTSGFTFNELANKLEDREEKSPTVVIGTYKGTTFNVIHCPDATSIESILDSFDMTWCRVGIDLHEQCIVAHPDADSSYPIFDANGLFAKNTSRNNMIERVFERFRKYRERRLKPCLHSDVEVHNELHKYIVANWPGPDQNVQKRFDNSY